MGYGVINNYGFSVVGSGAAVTVQICAGTCEDVCAATVSCPDGEFDCLGDGTECIPNTSLYVCDGWFDDCSNGADEADCPESCADQGLIDCGDGQCIYSFYICDGGYPDCYNGNDELNCGDECSDFQHDCGDAGSYYGDCITDSWVCDGMSDCYDGSDEADCATGCSDDQFDCNGDGTECVPNNSYYICDGWLDCYNGADEADCAPV